MGDILCDLDSDQSIHKDLSIVCSDSLVVGGVMKGDVGGARSLQLWNLKTGRALKMPTNVEKYDKLCIINNNDNNYKNNKNIGVDKSVSKYNTNESEKIITVSYKAEKDTVLFSIFDLYANEVEWQQEIEAKCGKRSKDVHAQDFSAKDFMVDDVVVSGSREVCVVALKAVLKYGGKKTMVQKEGILPNNLETLEVENGNNKQQYRSREQQQHRSKQQQQLQQQHLQQQKLKQQQHETVASKSPGVYFFVSCRLHSNDKQVNSNIDNNYNKNRNIDRNNASLNIEKDNANGKMNDRNDSDRIKDPGMLNHLFASSVLATKSFKLNNSKKNENSKKKDKKLSNDKSTVKDSNDDLYNLEAYTNLALTITTKPKNELFIWNMLSGNVIKRLNLKLIFPEIDQKDTKSMKDKNTPSCMELFCRSLNVVFGTEDGSLYVLELPDFSISRSVQGHKGRVSIFFL